MPQARHFKNNIKWKETVILGDLKFDLGDLKM